MKNSFIFGAKSKQKLSGLHPRGVKMVEKALSLSSVDFSVIETSRSLEKQMHNIQVGASWSKKSYHLPRSVDKVVYPVALAVDLYPWVDGKTSHLAEHYNLLAKAMFAAAQEEGVIVEWGGFWKDKFIDKPHWQIVGLNRVNRTETFSL